MALQAPPPPPPPNAIFSLNHQEPLSLNNSRYLNDRSQLLIDIERGTALRKVSNAQKGLNSRPLNEMKQVSSSNVSFFPNELAHVCINFNIFIEKSDLISASSLFFMHM